MKFCSECGSPVELRVLPPDDRPRYQCTACDYVHYKNPKVLVSVYATWQDKVLWMRRGTEPFKGLWTAPSGYLEEGEDLMEAAERELYEEVRARVDGSRMQLQLIGNLSRMGQVYVVFRAPLLEPVFSTTEEATEVALFTADEFPENEFAYPEVVQCVKNFYNDLKNNDFGVYMGTLQSGENVITRITSTG